MIYTTNYTFDQYQITDNFDQFQQQLFWIKSIKVATYYFDSNKDQTIFYIPGYGSWAQVYYKLLCGLSKYFNVCSYDLPGFGKSQIGKQKVSLEQHIEIINYILQQYKFKQIIMLGHSLGGQLCVEFVASKYFYNFKIIRTILLCPAGLNIRNTIKRTFKGTQFIQQLMPPTTYMKLYEKHVRKEFENEISQEYLNILFQQYQQYYQNVIKSVTKYQLFHYLKLFPIQNRLNQYQLCQQRMLFIQQENNYISAAFLLIFAEDDIFIDVKKSIQTLQNKIPFAYIKVYTQAKHQFPVYNYQQLIQDIKDFILHNETYIE